jgi:deferrochelatase/peroxidase EfeB
MRSYDRRLAKVQCQISERFAPRKPRRLSGAQPSPDPIHLRDDPQGLHCPITCHMPRVNTRDGLAPTGREGSVLNNRRRIIRRGLPYGDSSDGVPD